jgi:hypothetical protein
MDPRANKGHSLGVVRFFEGDIRAVLHKESRPSKVGAVSIKILVLMAPGSASSGHFNKSITGAKTLVCKGLGAIRAKAVV